jgi:prevent-host-death family protein
MAIGKQVLSDEARRSWREILNEVEHHGEHVIVLRYGTPTAVIVPVGWYEAAKAALEATRPPPPSTGYSMARGGS